MHWLLSAKTEGKKKSGRTDRQTPDRYTVPHRLKRPALVTTIAYMSQWPWLARPTAAGIESHRGGQFSLSRRPLQYAAVGMGCAHLFYTV